MSYTVPHFIQGERVTQTTITDHHIINNPATGKTIGRVDFANKTICDAAVASSKRAWEAWAQTPPIKRGQILFKFRTLLEQHQEELARIVTREHGKSIDDAKASIARGIEAIEWNCGLLHQLQGQFSANAATNIDCYSIRQPLGVCAGVSPFNFPVMVPIWMMIPAIACGNTFILKPSEQDPSAPLFLVELLLKAGLPAGVVNCLQGNKTTVDYLLAHPDIQTFTAVASTPVAHAIYTTAIAHGKRAHTFGGAKNHCLVMPDADIEQAAHAIVGAAYGSAGERCMAISVVVAVGDATANALRDKMLPLIQAINVDHGEAIQCDMGPLISAAHRAKVIAAIDAGVKDGAELIIDGRSFQHPTYAEGFYLGPSLFDHVTSNMTIYQQEIFGPVLIMLRAKNFAEALALVNQNQYGNGSAIFTRDGLAAREYSHRVHTGMVGINIPIPVPIVSHPFGGWKQSAFGDTNMHGLESIHFYTKVKTVTSRWVSASATNSFVMPVYD